MRLLGRTLIIKKKDRIEESTQRRHLYYFSTSERVPGIELQLIDDAYPFNFRLDLNLQLKRIHPVKWTSDFIPTRV